MASNLIAITPKPTISKSAKIMSICCSMAVQSRYLLQEAEKKPEILHTVRSFGNIFRGNPVTLTSSLSVSQSAGRETLKRCHSSHPITMGMLVPGWHNTGSGRIALLAGGRSQLETTLVVFVDILQTDSGFRCTSALESG